MDEQPFTEIPVGVYRFRAGDGKQSLDVLVNYANMAHKIAKERPGSSYVFYDDSIRRRMLEDTALSLRQRRPWKMMSLSSICSPR